MKNSFISIALFSTMVLFASCSKGPKPVAAFTVEPENALASDTVHFTNQTTDATTFTWTFGDDSVSTAENPVHIYSSGGTYTVTLTATGDGGKNTATRDITILPSVTGRWSSTFTSFIATNGILTLVQKPDGTIKGTMQLTQNSTATAILATSTITGSAVVVESTAQAGGRNGSGKYSFKGNINEAYDYITGSAFLDGNFLGKWYAIRVRNGE